MWGTLLVILGWIGLNPVPWTAYVLGVTEPAINLLISIFMAYPIAIFYHKFLKQYTACRNIFFIIAGLDMAYFNFGLSLYHNCVPALVIYATTKVLGPGKNNAIFTLVFNMGYLVTGYIITESEDYDITWTMPHCVLTLKLIALAFDLWDGQKKLEGKELSANNMKTALEKQPTFTELMGFVYFPSCFLVGPIFSFKRYADFINDKFPLDKKEDEYSLVAMITLVKGIAYLIAFQVGVSVFSMQYMTSDEFWERSIFYRHFYCGLWAHFALYKYISCWLITEASCIRFGLSYNGEEQFWSRWDGCNNIKLMRFETATKFQHYIDSFNCNTNHFAAEYIYKRLKFLGNRSLSQLFTLMFLALWHGTRSGYYMTFLNEFMIILMEKDVETILIKTGLYDKIWSNPKAKYASYVILKMYTIVFMGWSLAPFDLKVFSKWIYLYYSLYFSGFVIFAPWSFLYKPLVIKCIKGLLPVKNE